MVEPRGSAPRSTQCHCVVLLLDDGPEMERAPGLAPGKSGFASRRLDDFGIARVMEMGRPTGAAPARRSSQDRMLAVTSRPPFESDPATGAAPVWSRLQGECISCSAKPESKVAEVGGHAPHSTRWNDLFSKQSRRACPVQLPFEIGESP